MAGKLMFTTQYTAVKEPNQYPESSWFSITSKQRMLGGSVPSDVCATQFHVSFPLDVPGIPCCPSWPKNACSNQLKCHVFCEIFPDPLPSGTNCSLVKFPYVVNIPCGLLLLSLQYSSQSSFLFNGWHNSSSGIYQYLEECSQTLVCMRIIRAIQDFVFKNYIPALSLESLPQQVGDGGRNLHINMHLSDLVARSLGHILGNPGPVHDLAYSQ